MNKLQVSKISGKFYSQDIPYKSIEQKIGKWLDGKTLYRKIIKARVQDNTTAFLTLSDYGINDTDIVIIDVGESFAHYLVELTGAGYSPVDYYISNTDRSHVFINGSKVLTIQNQNNFIRDYYIVLKYTKTTD